MVSRTHQSVHVPSGLAAAGSRSQGLGDLGGGARTLDQLQQNMSPPKQQHITSARPHATALQKNAGSSYHSFESSVGTAVARTPPPRIGLSSLSLCQHTRESASISCGPGGRHCWREGGVANGSYGMVGNGNGRPYKAPEGWPTHAAPRLPFAHQCILRRHHGDRAPVRAPRSYPPSMPQACARAEDGWSPLRGHQWVGWACVGRTDVGAVEHLVRGGGALDVAVRRHRLEHLRGCAVHAR